ISMDFLHAFEDIDSDFSGEITTEELEAYCRRHNYEDRNGYDYSTTTTRGTITIEEFCDTLGLVPKQEYMEKVQTNREKSEGGGIMDGVKIITEDPELSDSTKEEIVRIARQAQEQFVNERDIARHMKARLDDMFGRAWHVIVGRYQYGSFCTHETGSLFHFYVLRNAVLRLISDASLAGRGPAGLLFAAICFWRSSSASSSLLASSFCQYSGLFSQKSRQRQCHSQKQCCSPSGK
uniref:EF-hand domain-containing protein n=1 Tax=Macrostomum lignano TaxID=282301 RepID=A0A1I8G1J6_9PLAT